jgi:hypothetical protein
MLSPISFYFLLKANLQFDLCLNFFQPIHQTCAFLLIFYLCGTVLKFYFLIHFSIYQLDLNLRRKMHLAYSGLNLEKDSFLRLIFTHPKLQNLSFFQNLRLKLNLVKFFNQLARFTFKQLFDLFIIKQLE